MQRERIVTCKDLVSNSLDVSLTREESCQVRNQGQLRYSGLFTVNSWNKVYCSGFV